MDKEGKKVFCIGGSMIGSQALIYKDFIYDFLIK